MTHPRPSRTIWILGSAAALGVVAWFGASVGSYLSTNIQGGPSCVALIRSVEVMPTPFDPASGPLSITADVARPVDALSFSLYDGDVLLASVAANASGTMYSGLWNGRTSDGSLVASGRYVVRATAESARCTTTVERPVMLRTALVPIVVLHVGETLSLTARREGDDVPLVGTWESSDPSVARMEGQTLHADAPGDATVWAGSSPYRSAPIEVRVLAPELR